MPGQLNPRRLQIPVAVDADDAHRLSADASSAIVSVYIDSRDNDGRARVEQHRVSPGNRALNLSARCTDLSESGCAEWKQSGRLVGRTARGHRDPPQVEFVDGCEAILANRVAVADVDC